ncbi:ABC transporter substrate-binding protein [Metabacillus halosaccharovorans]|uniref:ABC transporter substrate-binding protein n=1 Tax=Metabacillus halosaccharovorans TaxID=930124 RepID=UPI002040A503|nr:sugar ABC transporter substrate-binding protein [Metabacillus halosaccharovorans]MCM3439320.1 sugar ABC transporter substrate-binding protein [Metabacillus halosaccharovorans]
MRKVKKLSPLLLVLFLVSVFTSACSGDEESSPASSSSSGDDSIEIRVATWQTEETAVELFNKAKESFEAEHPNVTVKIEAAPYENYMTKLQTELAAGNPADIIQVGEQNFQRYMDKAILEDLTPLAEGTFDFDSEIIPNVKELMQVDGKNPVMSVGAATIGVYYNKKLFDEANLPYPQDGWTWEEFVELAEKLTIRDGDKFKQYGANLNLGKDWVEPFIVSNGGSYLSEDGSTSVGYLNSDATVEAFQKISDLYNVSKVAPNPAELVALKGIDLFATGQVAMNVNGSWAQADLQKNPDIEFGVVSLPTMSTGEKASLMYTSGMGISTKSKQKEVAWEFLLELTSPETDAGKMWAQSNLAVTNKLLESSAQTEDPYLSVFVEQLDHAIESGYYQNSYWGSVGDKLLAPAIQDMLLDPKVDFKQRLTDLTTQIDRELKQAAE